MAEEKKPQEKRGSGLGERMSDISGMRVFRNGKWMSMAELPKAAKAPAPKAVGGPVTEDKAPITSAGALVPEEQDLADALRVIVKQHGKFNEDNTGVWAGYDSAEKNAENAKIGVKCGNCVFWQSPNGCEIIDSKTEEGGLCRFAVLPDGTVTPEKVFSKYPDLTQEKLKKKINNMEDIYTEELLKISDLIPTQDYLTPIKLKGADDNTKLVTVYLDGEGYKLVDGHHRCAAKIMAGQNEIMAKVYREPLVATAGSKPAPKKDQVKGSDKNPKGSASGSKTINFSKKVEDSLSAKVEEHNEKSDRKANLRMLKAVYRRGAGAFSSSHRPDQNRSSWAMARVNAFLHLLKSGSPKNSAYTTDNDLLPSSHPKSSKRSVTASAEVEIDYDEYLSINLMSETEYTSKEHAIFSLAEYSGAGYEIIPALQASWSRAEKSNENAFERVKDLAVLLHDSKDADLLPKEF